MALKLINGSYKNRTRTLFSPDGEIWYEDNSYKIAADMSKFREDSGGGGFVILIAGILIIDFIYEVFIK